MGFADEMAEFDEQWEEDKTKTPTGAVLPDGKWQVLLVESRLEHDSSNETWTWVLFFQNAQGKVRKWNNLDREVSRSIAAQDAALLGFDGKLSGLQAWLESEESLFTVVEIAIKTKPGDGRDYTNVYLNRVLGKGNIDEFGGKDGVNIVTTPGAPAPGLDDDIPF